MYEDELQVEELEEEEPPPSPATYHVMSTVFEIVKIGSASVKQAFVNLLTP